jgi:uncharacterized membrane protein
MNIKQKNMTRSEAQRKSNDKYMSGEITREEWSKEFDEMSNPRIWSAEGKIEHGS